MSHFSVRQERQLEPNRAAIPAEEKLISTLDERVITFAQIRGACVSMIRAGVFDYVVLLYSSRLVGLSNQLMIDCRVIAPSAEIWGLWS